MNDEEMEVALEAAQTKIYNLQAKLDDLGSEFAIVNHFRHQVEIAKKALSQINSATEYAFSEGEYGYQFSIIAREALKEMDAA